MNASARYGAFVRRFDLHIHVPLIRWRNEASKYLSITSAGVCVGWPSSSVIITFRGVPISDHRQYDLALDMATRSALVGFIRLRQGIRTVDHHADLSRIKQLGQLGKLRSA